MELKDWLNSINFNKEDLSEHIKDYPPYIVNRCLSGHMDCVMYANEMNKLSHLDSKLQYEFLLNSIRPKKRFAKWHKPEQDDDIEVVSEFYNYSLPKARQVLSILSDNQLRTIREKMTQGIKDNEHNR